MKESLFLRLIDKYVKDTASTAEQKLVEEYYQRLDEKGASSPAQDEELVLKNMILQKIRQRLETPVHEDEIKPRIRMRTAHYLAAASVLLVLSAGIYFFRKSPEPQIVAKHQSVLKGNDAVLDTRSTILTLANGLKINLDNAKNGEIAKQGSTTLTKVSNHQLVYTTDESESKNGNSNLIYENTIQTPNGKQYEVDLADGSKIWINAASALKFPARFTGNDRKVELTGEGYFEVSARKSMPFKIKTDDQIVEVLGTHFNINAYSNEPVIKTTLVEGSVKVSELKRQQTQFLHSGEEANNSKHGSITVKAANTEQAVSWKNGNFSFNDLELVNIMRQLERWYDVDVDYSQIPKTRYNAHMSRDLKLSKVLEMLEVTGNVRFQIKENTIKVSDK